VIPPKKAVIPLPPAVCPIGYPLLSLCRERKKAEVEEIRTKKQFSPTNKEYLFFCSLKLFKQECKKQLFLL